MTCRAKLPGGFAIVVAAIFATACNNDSSRQAKRERMGQAAIAAFEKQQDDENPAHWDEARLLAALASPDVSQRANAATELGVRKSSRARRALRELMLTERNSVVVSHCQLALIRIGHPDDIAAIRDYAWPRIDALDAAFLGNLSLLDDPWVEDLLKEAWNRAKDNNRRRQVVSAQTHRRSRMTR